MTPTRHRSILPGCNRVHRFRWSRRPRHRRLAGARRWARRTVRRTPPLRRRCPQRYASASLSAPSSSSLARRWRRTPGLITSRPSGSIGRQYNVARSATPLARSPRLPRSAFFEGVPVVGSELELSFTIPQRFAPGRVAAGAGWRIEAAIAAALSSMHDEIDRSPHRVRIEGALGIGTDVLRKVVIPREYRRSAISRASWGESHERRFSPEPLPARRAALRTRAATGQATARSEPGTVGASALSTSASARSVRDVSGSVPSPRLTCISAAPRLPSNTDQAMSAISRAFAWR